MAIEYTTLKDMEREAEICEFMYWLRDEKQLVLCNVHRIQTGKSPAELVKEYNQWLRSRSSS